MVFDQANCEDNDGLAQGTIIPIALSIEIIFLTSMNPVLRSTTQKARAMNRLMLRYLLNTFPTTAAMCLHVKNVLNIFCDTQNSGAIT